MHYYHMDEIVQNNHFNVIATYSLREVQTQNTGKPPFSMSNEGNYIIKAEWRIYASVT